MSALAVADLRIAAGARQLVCGVSFALPAGTAITIVGDTGSGKTLVAEAVMGTLPRELSASGRIAVHGTWSDAAEPAARRPFWGRGIALLPQEPWLSLDPTMRAAPQVTEVFRYVRGMGGAAARARGMAELARLGLAAAARRYPFQLSGGMAQRTAFAAVRAGEAGIVIADEPTKGLDWALRDDVLAMLREEIARGAAVMTITHDIALARGLGGQVAVMLAGEIVELGPAERVLSQPAHDYTRRLLAADPASWPDPGPRPAGATVLAGERLFKALGGRTLFAGLDLELRAGETQAITGPSGCGKTTLGSVLLGLARPDAGRVSRSPGHVRAAFQKLYQDPPAAFAPRATLRVALADVCRRHVVAWSKVEALLARLRLAPELLDRRPDQVSGGELQRLALARVLLLDPVFLFADEATSRLDPITQQEVMALLRDAVAERGLSLLLVTHDRMLAAKSAARVLDFAAADRAAAA